MIAAVEVGSAGKAVTDVGISVVVSVEVGSDDEGEANVDVFVTGAFEIESAAEAETDVGISVVVGVEV